MSTSERVLTMRRRARRGVPVALSAVALVVGVSGCASTSASTSGDFGGSRVQTAVLQEAYATLSIPVTDLDQQSRTIGNNAYRVRRRIGDVPTMRALDCGGDSGMPNAETYQLLLTVKSRIIPNDGGGSVVQTTLEGTGKNATTAASSDVRCSSMGALEKRIADFVKAKVAAK